MSESGRGVFPLASSRMTSTLERVLPRNVAGVVVVDGVCQRLEKQARRFSLAFVESAWTLEKGSCQENKAFMDRSRSREFMGEGCRADLHTSLGMKRDSEISGLARGAVHSAHSASLGGLGMCLPLTRLFWGQCLALAPISTGASAPNPHGPKTWCRPFRAMSDTTSMLIFFFLSCQLRTTSTVVCDPSRGRNHCPQPHAIATHAVLYDVV
ncbi:hypothetical protein GGR56DRAFT_488493 [Xylariaceae sp. FL0804]|nr:hypothetical protein GGR56DRAFT_488493 [Xylariaceae sp. FL0804]